MRAFKVYLNGKKLCLAGIGDDGVLSAITNWVAGGRYKAADLFLEVGGLISPTREHVKWIKQKPLGVGDEIRVKIVDTDSVDGPVERHRSDSARDLENQKAYVRATARQLGWTLREQPRKTKSLRPKKGSGIAGES
ncbi:MAG: hypothetical protein WBV69_13375 [Candidatus Sulfotelmatobacter sp.]